MLSVGIPLTRGWTYTHCSRMHNYSLLGRDVERDVIPMMRRYGLGLTVWSPLASGFLSGKYTRENLSDPNNRFSGFDILPFDKEKGFVVVERLRELAARHRATVAQVAIAWLLTKDAVSSASKLHQLEDNLGAVNVKLDAAEVSDLDTATALPPVYPDWFTERIAVDQPLAEALSVAKLDEVVKHSIAAAQ